MRQDDIDQNIDALVSFDREHIWHPYGPLPSPMASQLVESARGTRLRLADGRELIDGMSSWWAAIHGYAHPVLDAALEKQMAKMSHVMFGGLTHRPAIALAQRLVEITPELLDCVFFSDSGSVSVEVAIKMALQYWGAAGRSQKQKLVALRGGYHGDTFAAMSVCAPNNGLQHRFRGVVPEQIFVDRPEPAFGQACEEAHIASLRRALAEHHARVAALILEPIVQGAGGMRFYSADYLARARGLCDEFDVLLIADEIATGFGRSGALFGCDHANVAPDIMCIGKALTGGTMTLAATLTTRAIAERISSVEPGLMHGPTFMANPLACAVALASVDLLLGQAWQDTVQRIEAQLRTELQPCTGAQGVADVRVLGAIGVVEFRQPVDVKFATERALEAGVWLRPFGNLLYTMPPFIIEPDELSKVCQVMRELAETAR